MSTRGGDGGAGAEEEAGCGGDGAEEEAELGWRRDLASEGREQRGRRANAGPGGLHRPVDKKRVARGPRVLDYSTSEKWTDKIARREDPTATSS
jgi:hypothetical protein